MAPKAKRCVADLQEDIVALDARGQACKAELRRMEQCLQGPRPYTAFERNVALTIFVMHKWGREPAVACLRVRVPEHGDIVEQLETWALEEPLARMIVLDDAAEAPHASVFKKAADFYTKWRLAAWVSGRMTMASAHPQQRCSNIATKCRLT